MYQSWRLGWRTLWRDVRAGELRLLTTAVLLAVAALSTVTFFANRLDAALRRDAVQLLGGDVVISSDHPLPPSFLAKAQSLRMRTTQTQTFSTMSRATQEQGGAARLVTLKAVDDGYPLRGNLRVSSNTHWQAGEPDQVASKPLQAGQVVVEAALLEALQINVGDTLLLGNKPLRITQVLTREPDRGAGFISFSPRVLMHATDLPATDLVQPASRIAYRLAVVGSAASVREYEAWARAEVDKTQTRGVRVETLEEGNPRMHETLGRASNFLHLVALLAAFLSAVAVALAAKNFAARHLDACAMLRVLGLPQRTIAQAYAFEFTIAGLAGTLLGLLAGLAVHYLLVLMLGGLIQIELPPPDWQAAILGLGVGMTLLLAFGLPPVLQLAQTPPLRVMRRDLGRVKAISVLTLATGLAGFAALLFAVSRDLKLGGIAVGGFAGAVLLFVAMGWLAVFLIRRSMGSKVAQYLPNWLRLALRQLGARPVFAVIQISSLSISMLALVLLVLLRTDLVRSWQQAIPADANNRYVINILPDQAKPVQEALRAAGVAKFDWFPMVRGRLVAVNGRTLTPADYPTDQAKRLVEREFNLSYSATLPAWTPLEQGNWSAGDKNMDANAISMEAGIMQTLNLKLGDRLVFELGGVQRTSTITSVRKVNWSSMRVNFFAMYPVASLGEDAAVTYITAYRSPPSVAGQPSLDARLLQDFPNITQIDMDSTLLQLQAVLEQVILAVEVLFVFGLAAGMLVLFATVNSTREERMRELAIMRALGSSSVLLGRVQSVELLLTGALSGLFAGAVSLGIAYALAHYVFMLEWSPVWWVLPAAMAAGAVLAWLAAWWSLRSILRQPVSQSLRSTL